MRLVGVLQFLHLPAAGQNKAYIGEVHPIAVGGGGHTVKLGLVQ